MKALCLQAINLFDKIILLKIKFAYQFKTVVHLHRVFTRKTDHVTDIHEEKLRPIMLSNTSSQQQWFPISCSLDSGSWKSESFSYVYVVTFTTSVFIAFLSPVAVVGNALILAAIWKKTFVRTPFHILLSGLAITDLCTGLIAQPFVVAVNFIFVTQPQEVCNRPTFLLAIRGIANGSATLFISITVLFITLISIERWQHMSRRSMVTSHRGCLTVTSVLLLPIPLAILRCFFTDAKETYEREVYIAIMTMVLFCFVTTSFAYFNVYWIIRHHKRQVRANEKSQNFGQPGIDLAKYKKSVVSILYILLLFSVCFLPSVIISSVAYLLLGERLELAVPFVVSLLLLFLSCSLNPVLYVWRMNDIDFVMVSNIYSEVAT